VRDYPHRQGKYFRPGLLLLSAELFGGKRSKALGLAATVQLAEDWILIHDDIEDQATERRSSKNNIRPTLNKLHGDEIAINAGDALHVIMWKMLGDVTSGLGMARSRQIYQKFAGMLLAAVEGQFLELSWRKKSFRSLKAQHYFDIVNKKTASYSITGPVQLGALAAGVTSASEHKKIDKWCRPFALSFQIWDDCLDADTTARSGKTAGNDLQESKPTLLLVHLFQKATAKESGRADKILRKPLGTKTAADAAFISRLMRKYGSVEYAQKTAQQFSAQAAREFTKNTAHLPATPAKRLFLEAMAFVSNRSK
jgi:geranylgeranyl diphosphate synthase type II